MQAAPKEIFYVPNLLSLSRLVLVVPIGYLIRLNTSAGDTIMLLLIFVAGITDILDGYLSRRLNQRTELGRVLDPLCDKIAMAVVLVLLAVYRGFPVSLVALLIYRDVIILALGLIVTKRTGKVVAANLLGKANTAVVSSTAVLFLLGVTGQVLAVAIVASHIVIWVSGMAYYVSAAPFLLAGGRQRSALALGIMAGAVLVVRLA